jgi:hypothetical protein
MEGTGKVRLLSCTESTGKIKAANTALLSGDLYPPAIVRDQDETATAASQ